MDLTTTICLNICEICVNKRLERSFLPKRGTSFCRDLSRGLCSACSKKSTSMEKECVMAATEESLLETTTQRSSYTSMRRLTKKSTGFGTKIIRKNSKKLGLDSGKRSMKMLGGGTSRINPGQKLQKRKSSCRKVAKR